MARLAGFQSLINRAAGRARLRGTEPGNLPERVEHICKSVTGCGQYIGVVISANQWRDTPILFYCLIRVGLSWLVSISLIGLLCFIVRGDSLGETISYNTHVPSTAVVVAAICITQGTATHGSLKLFVAGTVLFLATLPVYAFVTGAPRFMFTFTGNKPLDYAILYGAFYLLLAVTFFFSTWSTFKKQKIKRD
jgi:hypothetical protein